MDIVNVNGRATTALAIEDLTAVPPGEQRTALLSRLVSQVYRESPLRLRARLLECLMRPIGPLALSAVAAGAFASFVYRPAWNQLLVVPGAAEPFSAAQVFELARFVEQYQPDAIAQLARVLADDPTCVHTIAGAMLFLAIRLWTRKRDTDDD